MSVPTAADIKAAKAALVAAEGEIDAQEYAAAGKRLAPLAARLATWERETPPGPPVEPGPWEFTWENFVDPPDRPACLAPTALPKACEATMHVRTDFELKEALVAARDAGPRVIALADGTYRHPIDSDASDLFIVADGRDAVLAAPAAFSGERVLARGATFAKPVTVSGQKISILGSTFTGPDGIVVASSARHVRIGCNRFTGNAGGKRSDHILIKCPTSGSAIPDFIRIYRNHFRDTNRSSTGEAHHVYVCEAYAPGTSRARFQSCVIALNLIGDEGKPSSRRRGIYLKNGGVDHFANVTHMHRGTAGQRHGGGSRFWGNRWIGVRDLALGGADHDLRGNSWNTPLQVMSEHLSGTSNRYQAADRFTLAMCEGPVTIGYVVAGGKVQRKVGGGAIHAHKGDVRRAAEQGTAITETCRMACPDPVTLTVRDVGPESIPA